MGAENKLSDKALRALMGKVQPAQRHIADGKGLSARISKKGGISFVFFYRLGDRDSSPLWLTLGRYPDMSLKQAREKRDQCRAWLAENRDPRIQLKLCAEKTLKPVTVQETLDYWYENYASVKRAKHQDAIYRFRLHIYPHIGDFPLEQCGLSDWMACFDRIKKNAPVMAAYVFADVRQALKFCRIRQFAVSNVLNDLRMTDVGEFAKRKERFLSEDELRDVCNHIFKEKLWALASLYNRRVMTICLIFGCRLSEVRLSTWSEWDFENWVWTVPAEHSKNKKEIIRPIPQGIKQWLVNLHAETKYRDYMLGSYRDQKQISTDVGKIWKRLGHKSSWTLHDFRRTISTYLNDFGCDFFAVESLLGHTIKGVAGIYNRSQYMHKKSEALDLWFTYLDGLTNQNSKVKVLKREVA
ncbi:tyrosine-type recombinase/integrase [Citrobacter pasteurii]